MVELRDFIHRLKRSKGQNVENKNFPVKCCLLAFYTVALGPAVSLELFASTAYVASLISPVVTHIIYPRPVFLRRRLSFTSIKLHVSVETFSVCFFRQFD